MSNENNKDFNPENPKQDNTDNPTPAEPETTAKPVTEPEPANNTDNPTPAELEPATSLAKFTPPPTPLTRGNDNLTNKKQISPKLRKTLLAIAALLVMVLLVSGGTIITKFLENRENFTNESVADFFLPTTQVEQIFDIENVQTQTGPSPWQDVSELLNQKECAILFQTTHEAPLESMIAQYAENNTIVLVENLSKMNNVSSAKKSFQKLTDAAKKCTSVYATSAPEEIYNISPLETNVENFEATGTKISVGDSSNPDSSIFMIHVRVKNVIITIQTSTENQISTVATAAANFLNNRIKTSDYLAANTDSPTETPKNFTNGTVTVGTQTSDSNKVEVKVYLDYLCGYCRDFALTQTETLDRLQAENLITLQYRPIAFLDAQNPTGYSRRALNAAACVTNENKDNFEPFSKALFTVQPENTMEKLSNEKLVELAQTATGTNTVTECINNQTYDAWAAQQTIQAANITGTPTITINGKKFDGNFQTAGELEQAILAAQ